MGSGKNTKGARAKRDRAWAQRVLANSGADQEGFGEPQGWSLKWDGAGFAEDAEGSDREHPLEPSEAD
jgi:hypothetical protein